MLSLHILMHSRFYCIINEKFINLINDKIELDKIFDEINVYVLLFNSRHVIHIPSFGIEPSVLWTPF